MESHKEIIRFVEFISNKKRKTIHLVNISSMAMKNLPEDEEHSNIGNIITTLCGYVIYGVDKSSTKYNKKIICKHCLKQLLVDRYDKYQFASPKEEKDLMEYAKEYAKDLQTNRIKNKYRNFKQRDHDLKQRSLYVKGIKSKVGELKTLNYKHLSDKDLGKLAAAILRSDVTNYIVEPLLKKKVTK